MSTHLTSPEAQPGASGALAQSTVGQWQRFFAFLRRPVLPDRALPPSRDGLVAVVRMLGLDALAMGVLMAIAGAVIALGFDLPETALADMDITPALLALVVVAAPIGEELVFRSWLSGRPGHVLGAILFAIFTLLATGVLGATVFKGSDPVVSGVASLITGGAIGMVAAAAVVFALRRRGAMRWFQRLFPLFYWLSVLAFAGVHVFNFAGQAWWLVLPLVIPQFVLGAILGYLRVNFGLWANILTHAVHNGTILGFVLLASALVGGE